MKKKALLVVSFGTSYEETRKKTIDAIELDFEREFIDYEIRRAFTSQMIIDKLKRRDGIRVLNTGEALKRLLDEGFQEVVVQPTHVINGSEFDSVYEDVLKYKNAFRSLKIGSPLLTSIADYRKVVFALSDVFPDDYRQKNIILMGHGSEHHANSAYACLDYVFKEEGFSDVHIATVEGFPEIHSVIDKINSAHKRDVLLMPLMVVAGDHVQNDLVGDSRDSWKNTLISFGYSVDAILIGMGEIRKIREIFIEHAKTAKVLA